MLGVERVLALADVPAVVPPADDDVDLLVPVLADIGGPEGIRLSVEGIAPHVAQAVRPHPPADGAAAIRERVVLGDGVVLAGVFAAHVDAEDLAVQHVQVLGVRVRVARKAPVTHADVQVAVRSKPQAPAVVVAVGFGELKQLPSERGWRGRDRLWTRGTGTPPTRGGVTE